MLKISEGNSKMGKVVNVSLPPIKACGNCKACAKDCYALKAYRMYTNVKKAWDGNFKTLKDNRKAFFDGIEERLAKKPVTFFRWHVSGDIIDQNYLDRMIIIAMRFPSTKFLAFTKMHKLDYKGLPKNFSVVFSMFPTMPEHGKDMPTAWVQDGNEKRIPSNALECPGVCDTCGMCWNLKSIGRDVYFNKH